MSNAAMGKRPKSDTSAAIVGGGEGQEVELEEPEENGAVLRVRITYEAAAIERAVFCVGFVDESGREIGAAASPPITIDGGHGSEACEIRPLPLRSSIYFPVVALVAPDGRFEDRWRLDRAIVIDRNGEVALADTVGPVDIPATWSNASEESKSIAPMKLRPTFNGGSLVT